MVSRIVVEVSERTGRKVFRFQPSHRPFAVQIASAQQNTSVSLARVLAAPASPPSSSLSGFALAGLVSRLPVALPVNPPLYPVPPAVETGHLKEALSPDPGPRQETPTGGSSQSSVATTRNTVSDAEATAYTEQVIEDRIRYILKRNGASYHLVEPIFDVIYRQRFDRLYTEVYGETYDTKEWTPTELDGTIATDLRRATTVFRSFAATRLTGREAEWQPRTTLEQKMSGEWYADLVDKTVASIMKQRAERFGDHTQTRVDETVPDSPVADHCAHVPEELRRAYLATNDIGSFDPKAFEGLPALFELPRWDIERSSGKEPRLNKVEVDCEKMLSYDYPAVLAHRIKMLKAEGGEPKDIRILEELKANIETVLSQERYLSSSVWEANNTARHIALEGEEGLRRAYTNSTRTFVRLLMDRPAVMEQVEYLGIPSSSASGYFTLLNDPLYRVRLEEAVTAYVMDRNSNLEEFSGASVPETDEDAGFKAGLLQKVVASFGTATA